MEIEKFYRKSTYKKEEKGKLMTNSPWLGPFWQYLYRQSQHSIYYIFIYVVLTKITIYGLTWGKTTPINKELIAS